MNTYTTKVIVIGIILAIDIAINYLQIKKDLKPNHILNTIVRSIVILPLLYNQEWTTWIEHGIIVAFSYMHIFDCSLNLLRKERISYIGIADERSLWNILLSYKGQYSLLDQIQLKTVGEGPAFWFRTILFIFCTIMVLVQFNPYF